MEKMNERVKMGMLEVKWILIDEDNTIDEKWSYYDSTYAMQVPGGVVGRHQGEFRARGARHRKERAF